MWCMKSGGHVIVKEISCPVLSHSLLVRARPWSGTHEPPSVMKMRWENFNRRQSIKIKATCLAVWPWNRASRHLWAAMYKINKLLSYLRCCIVESPCCRILTCIPVITTANVKVFLQTSCCIVMITVSLASLQVSSLFSICIRLIPTWRFLSA